MIYKNSYTESASVPDVLSSAWNTDDVWGPLGVFEPAPIVAFDLKMYDIDQKMF